MNPTAIPSKITRLPSALHCALASFAALLLLLTAPAARAGEVSLELDTREVGVGEAITASLTISNFANCSAPQFPEIADCTVRSTGIPTDARYFTSINGRASQSITRTYRFELVPQKAGPLIVPPVEVEVDGEKLRTAPLTVRVGASQGGTLLFVEVACSTPKLYVGQQAQLTLSIWIKPASFRGALLDENEMRNFISVAQLGVFPNQIVRTRRERRENAAGERELFYVYEIETRFTADRPGELRFDDVEVGMRYPIELVRDFFELRPRRSKNLRATPSSPPIQVLPLPDAGRPDGFTGAVGRFEVRAAASPTRCRVGDPIELTLDIIGDGPLNTLPPPALRQNRQLADGFRLPDEDLAGEVLEQRKRFKPIVRPLRPDVRELPPIEYPYFDPELGEYRVARSQTIPLEVSPSETLHVADVTANAPAQSDAKQSIAARDGLLANINDPALVLQRAWRPGKTAVIAAILLPPGLFALTWLGLVRRRGDSADLKRRRSAAANARKALRQADSSAAAKNSGSILATYLAERFGFPAAHFVGGQHLADLQQLALPKDVLERVSRTIERCDAVAYAAVSAADAGALLEEAQRTIDAVEAAA
ncbi:MAG: BatD family protein [Phycisphaerae bacterium]|nr:BatD family protein [Phycisphaerae bacterium]